MNPPSIPNPNIPPHRIPSPRYTQHPTNPSAFSNLPPSYQISTTPPETRLYSAPAPPTTTTTTNINDLPAPPNIPDWSLFDAPILSMMGDPTTTTTTANGPDHLGLPDPSWSDETEDAFHTLFHNSFDIWGALDDPAREGAAEEAYVV